ncbi:hypothetical protein IWW45_009505, partial [Coemansia sp. RSA 485]
VFSRNKRSTIPSTTPSMPASPRASAEDNQRQIRSKSSAERMQKTNVAWARTFMR